VVANINEIDQPPEVDAAVVAQGHLAGTAGGVAVGAAATMALSMVPARMAAAPAGALAGALVGALAGAAQVVALGQVVAGLDHAARDDAGPRYHGQCQQATVVVRQAARRGFAKKRAGSALFTLLRSFDESIVLPRGARLVRVSLSAAHAARVCTPPPSLASKQPGMHTRNLRGHRPVHRCYVSPSVRVLFTRLGVEFHKKRRGKRAACRRTAGRRPARLWLLLLLLVCCFAIQSFPSGAGERGGRGGLEVEWAGRLRACRPERALAPALKLGVGPLGRPPSRSIQGSALQLVCGEGKTREAKAVCYCSVL
jgi:hypothetical protein